MPAAGTVKPGSTAFIIDESNYARHGKSIVTFRAQHAQIQKPLHQAGEPTYAGTTKKGTHDCLAPFACVLNRLAIALVRCDARRSELYLSHCAGIAMVTDHDIDGRDCTSAGSQVARQANFIIR